MDLPIYSAKEGSIAALVDASPAQMQVDSPASLLDSHISIDSRGEKIDDDDIGRDSNANLSAVYAFRMSQATLAASFLVEEGPPSAAPEPTRVLIVDDSSMNRYSFYTCGILCSADNGCLYHGTTGKLFVACWKVPLTLHHWGKCQ